MNLRRWYVCVCVCVRVWVWLIYWNSLRIQSSNSDSSNYGRHRGFRRFENQMQMLQKYVMSVTNCCESRKTVNYEMWLLFILQTSYFDVSKSYYTALLSIHSMKEFIQKEFCHTKEDSRRLMADCILYELCVVLNVRETVKSDYWLRHYRLSICLSFRHTVCPFVRPSEWNNSDPTGRIFMKFYVWGFFEYLSRDFQFSSKPDKNSGWFTGRSIYIYENI
jgi:hypothetical protein